MARLLKTVKARFIFAVSTMVILSLLWALTYSLAVFVTMVVVYIGYLIAGAILVVIMNWVFKGE